MGSIEHLTTSASATHPDKTMESSKHSDTFTTDTVTEFKPLQSLMEHEITLEFGPQLKLKRIIHQELLCCYSKKMYDLFVRAEGARKPYAKAEKMRKDLKTCLRNIQPAEEDEDYETELIDTIMLIQTTYPQINKRKDLGELIISQVDEHVSKKQYVKTTTIPKKELQSMQLRARLESLNVKGLMAIAQSVYDQLHQYKQHITASAKNNSLIAATQRRLMLPNAEERVIKSLVAWLYGNGALNYDDAQHLYALHALADEIGITALAEQSLARLALQTTDIIQAALAEGLSLQILLGLGTDEELAKQQTSRYAEGNVAEVVFNHILKDVSPPERLRQLVVDTLALYLDTSLWSQLTKDAMPNISKLIIEAMLRLREEIKKEPTGMKMED